MGKGVGLKREALRLDGATFKKSSLARTHVSTRQLTRIRSARQNAEPSHKPNGLWYEVGGDWRRWCRSEMPDYVEGNLLYALRGISKLNMLYLTTPEEIRQFSNKYGEKHWPFSRENDSINWKQVAAEYDGVEVAPYQWEIRHKVRWYYGWDVASGCIWRPGKLDARYLRTLAKP